ncbi:MAG: homoserine dehydrogenase [Nitrospirae bacterium]|nr:homoserine dehydrogenase [Nitrospirota bacterium]
MKKKINVGLIGLGTVGGGVVNLLRENADVIKRRLGVSVELVRAADLDASRAKALGLGKDVYTKDARAVINDPNVDVVIELIGGYEPAKTFLLEALALKKPVVTANKALLAMHGEELYKAAYAAKTAIGFEASVAGGIPIIGAMKQGLAANDILSIYGIINGTCNYILTKMADEGRKFDELLAEAQKLGYAEADPTFDVEGIDPAHKLAVLANIAFGTPVKFEEIYTEGISKIRPEDIEHAKELGYKVKLLAITKVVDGEIELRVHPTMLPADHLIAKVDGVFNAVYVQGDFLGPAMFYGRGAGDKPTASAVVSDVMDIARDILSGAKSRMPVLAFKKEGRKAMRVRPIGKVRCCYYLRFTALDRPGVLSKISGVLGRHDISVASVIQKGREEGGAVPIVMMTHDAVEKNVRSALAKLDGLDVIAGPTVVIRVECGE